MTVKAVGDRLRVQGPPAVLTEDLVRRLREMKQDILAALRPPAGPALGWTAADWQEYFEERLAVALIDGEQPEDDVRAIAWEGCIVQWRNLHPAASDPSRCAFCGTADRPGNLVPFGVGPHVWLHSPCWPTWDRDRRTETAAALAALGIIR